MKINLTVLSIAFAIIISCQSNNKNQYVKLTEQLDSIFETDQSLRMIVDSIEQKYGFESEETQGIWQKIHENDSINLIKIDSIISKYGWLGVDKIGEKGNAALFLVIQHSDLKTQEKYLPMMKDAVKKGNANGSDLALLIDRIEMFNGRPQVYGSQIQYIDGKYTIYKIIDEKNVNKRRSEVGLQPLEEYVKIWNINYKLPE
jgi:hypothetical protein